MSGGGKIKLKTSGNCQSVTDGSCGKKKTHFDEARCHNKAYLCVGCRVSLLGVNIKPEWGLYHGSIGTVLDIVYRNPEGPHFEGKPTEKHPAFVLVDFPQYCGPNMYQDDDYITSDEKKKRRTWVAVPMVTVRCSNHGMCTRTYMPLSLAFGKTIHSFQGASVGPTPKGRPDNPFLRIVADTGTRKFESTNTHSAVKSHLNGRHEGPHNLVHLLHWS